MSEFITKMEELGLDDLEEMNESSFSITIGNIHITKSPGNRYVAYDGGVPTLAIADGNWGFDEQGVFHFALGQQVS